MAQRVICVLMVLLRFLDLVLKSSLHPMRVSGSTILSDGLLIGSWVFTAYLLKFELERLTPRVNRHCVATLGFFALVTIRDCLAFLGWNNPSWFWIGVEGRGGRETASQDVADLVVFCFDLIGCCVSLIMAVASPAFRGRKSVQLRMDMLCMNKDGDDDVEGGGEEIRGLSNKSTFRNLWTKCKQLAPYLWPKKHWYCVYVV